MIHYRVYKMHRCGGLRSGHDVICASDEDARRRAAGLVMDDTQAEVWQGTRCLGRVTAAAVPDNAGRGFCQRRATEAHRARLIAIKAERAAARGRRNAGDVIRDPEKVLPRHRTNVLRDTRNVILDAGVTGGGVGKGGSRHYATHPSKAKSV